MSRPWRVAPTASPTAASTPIHLLLIGVGNDNVLRNCGRGERCLRLWISRFNEQGIDGLTYRPHGGRPRQPGRALPGVVEGEPSKLFAALEAAAVLGGIEFEMRARKGTKKVKGSTVALSAARRRCARSSGR